MGRKQIPLTDSIERLSILDENGQVDHDLEPDLPPELHLKMFRSMLLGRRFDERMLNLQRQGRIGTFPPIKGQEAAHVGAVAALRDSDWFVPSFRETAAEIMRGRSMESVLLYYNGFNEGTRIPKDQKDMPMAVPVASQVIHAVGLGYAAKYRKTDEVVMAFFGDGATSEGDFHEGLNCAAVYKAPVIYVCQNNQWAISIPVSKQTASATLVQKAVAYGMPGIQVDGNDILAVHTAAREAIERARNGGGPTFIEAITYRIMMHTTADDPSRYRDDGEVEDWKTRGPIARYTSYLKTRGILDQQTIDGMEAEIQGEIQAAVERAEAQMKQAGNPLEMFDHLFAELPPHLARQKEELREELQLRQTGDGAGKGGNSHA